MFSFISIPLKVKHIAKSNKYYEGRSFPVLKIHLKKVRSVEGRPKGKNKAKEEIWEKIKICTSRTQFLSAELNRSRMQTEMVSQLVDRDISTTGTGSHFITCSVKDLN